MDKFLPLKISLFSFIIPFSSFFLNTIENLFVCKRNYDKWPTSKNKFIRKKDCDMIFVTILNIYVIFASFDTEEVLFVLEFMLHFSVFRILCSILP
ncbi:hypothetical protein FKB33_02885 [Enterococcus faecium]|nr:hypothetical protein [Enterococcus faecium]